jgi:hypothetical protein
MSESLVFCDVTDLVNLPVPGDPPLARLVGQPKQVRWAETIRTSQTIEWHHDLPELVYKAVLTIEDATWWIAKRENDASHIKWPVSWLSHSKRLNMFKPTNGPPPEPTPQGKTLMEVFAEEDSKRSRTVAEAAEAAEARVKSEREKVDADQFESFARKVANSPELAYLTILSQMFRISRNPHIHIHYEKARERVLAHLKAIKDLAGAP